MSDAESTPAVVSYRVGQLEMTQKEGFASLNDKLDGMLAGFVTEKEMTEAKLEAADEHKRIWAAITDIKNTAKWYIATGIAVAGVIVTYISIK